MYRLLPDAHGWLLIWLSLMSLAICLAVGQATEGQYDDWSDEEDNQPRWALPHPPPWINSRKYDLFERTVEDNMQQLLHNRSYRPWGHATLSEAAQLRAYFIAKQVTYQAGAVPFAHDRDSPAFDRHLLAVMMCMQRVDSEGEAELAATMTDPVFWRHWAEAKRQAAEAGQTLEGEQCPAPMIPAPPPPLLQRVVVNTTEAAHDAIRWMLKGGRR
jgi:hypothetical protein